MRDYNQEYQDQGPSGRKYSYEFDDILRAYMWQTFAPFLPDSKTPVLELSCFKGRFTELLAQRFDQITVIEASEELIEVARSRVGSAIQFIHSTFEEAELTDRFGAVFLIHTLEHLDDARLVLSRIRDWLDDNGVLLLAVPNANAASRQIAVKMGLIEHNSAVTEGERIHGHRKTYSLDTLETEAVSAGLQVEARGGVFFKALANFQLDRALNEGIVSSQYLDGCYKLGMIYPDLAASIYLICSNRD